jgi:hypothetical protein
MANLYTLFKTRLKDASGPPRQNPSRHGGMTLRFLQFAAKSILTCTIHSNGTDTSGRDLCHEFDPRHSTPPAPSQSRSCLHLDLDETRTMRLHDPPGSHTPDHELPPPDALHALTTGFRIRVNRATDPSPGAPAWSGDRCPAFAPEPAQPRSCDPARIPPLASGHPESPPPGRHRHASPSGR